MKYRMIGKTGVNASALGFGCMRFPMKHQVRHYGEMLDPNTPVDEELTVKLLRRAYEGGINYFDTAYFYVGGRSETLLAKGVKDFRKDIYIADKMPPWPVEKKADFERIFNDQLNRLQTDYIDFYLLHNMNRSTWKKLYGFGALDFLENAKKDGLIRFTGFSFHDDAAFFKELVDQYDWDMCQIQYNFFDVNFQAGAEGLKYAAGKGMGAVIMEPLRGGKLTERIPEPVAELWDSAPAKRTPADWCLKWVWDQPEVSVVLSGMSAIDQLDENMASADDAEAGSLLPEEHAIIANVRETYEKMLKVPCTGCAYCLPCPTGVNIPFNFSMYNDTYMFHDADVSHIRYGLMFAPEARAGSCVECGECLEKCPQGINIPEELKKVHHRLAVELKPA